MNKKPPSPKRPKATKKIISPQPRAESDTNANRAEERQGGNASFVIVGVGASAGGLEAFKQLFAHLPVDTGMAFVMVMHLDPKHESILTDLLAKATRMPVSEVQDGMAVAPDHVYVIPRNTSMAIEGGVLRLRPRQEGRGGAAHRFFPAIAGGRSEHPRHRRYPVGRRHRRHTGVGGD